MGPIIKTHALANTIFVTHPYKRSIECAMDHTTEARQVKTALCSTYESIYSRADMQPDNNLVI